MLERLGVASVILAVLAPWTTWLAFGIAPPTDAYMRASEFFVVAGGIAFLGAVLALEDLWLGSFVIAASLLALAARQELFTAFVIMLASASLIAVRAATRAGWARWLRYLLVATALTQSLLALSQALFWRPEWGAGYPPLLLAYGTFGNVKYLGALLAIVTPLAPLWALPVLGIGLGLSQSGVACVAALVGVLLRPDVSSRWRIGSGAMVTLALTGALFVRTLTLDSLWSRLAVWSLAFQDVSWPALVLGHGPNSWYQGVPAAQIAAAHATGVTHANLELFHYGHNEPLQLAYEFGLVGLVLLFGWLWAYHRPLLTSPWRGAVAAIVILMCWLHIFHVPMVAPAAVAILGMATSDARG